MHLDIIRRYPAAGRPVRATPLLFVHGSFAGAEVWDAHFLPYFAEHGYAAHAVSLRGHGASDGHAGLRGWRLRDYVTDLHQAVATLPRPPVLIGHSLGGMVIQKYLERQRVPAVALLASVPPQGLLPSLWGMAVAHPALLWGIGLLQTGGPRYASLDLLRRALFSERTPDQRLRGYARWLQGESQRVSLDLLGLDPLRLRRDHGIPMLVLGGGRDAFFSPGLVHDTARHYGTEALIFPDLAHALMLEADWQQPADYLRRWLEARLSR